MCRQVVGMEHVRNVIQGLEQSARLVARRSGARYAARNVLQNVREADQLARCESVSSLLQGLAGPGMFPVRGILFDKVPGANWPVGWHQDQVIAVRKRVDVPGFAPWSVKAGVTHVRPPEPVLKAMLTLRVHLDDSPETNGALKVIPGSHMQTWDDNQMAGIIDQGPVMTMEAKAGDVLAMRPLILHASSMSQSPAHRRVLHIEYAREPLAGGLQWYDGLNP